MVYALFTFVDDGLVLSGLFYNLYHCLDYSVANNLKGMCVAFENLTALGF